jgi:DNA-binding response OmpR family regulator
VILGLGVGADDYVTKPFRPKELLARVQGGAAPRPAAQRGAPTGERVVRGDLMIDLVATRCVIGDGRAGVITPTEMRLLHFLATHPGRVFTRAHLLSRVIGEDAIVTDRNVDVHVGAIRQKLGELPRADRDGARRRLSVQGPHGSGVKCGGVGCSRGCCGACSASAC